MEDLNIGRGAVEREEAAGGTIFRENNTYNSHKALKWQMPMNTFFCIMATIIFLCTTKVESIEISRHGEIPFLSLALTSLPSSAQKPLSFRYIFFRPNLRCSLKKTSVYIFHETYLALRSQFLYMFALFPSKLEFHRC